MKKVLVAISYSGRLPYPEYFNAQLQTWIEDKSPRLKVIRYRSKTPPRVIQMFEDKHEKLRFSERWGKLIGRVNRSVSPLISRNIPNYSFDPTDSMLSVDTWSTVRLFGRRNLALFSWFIEETDFDFLFAVNTSTYINPKLLLEFIDTLNPNEELYAGAVQKNGQSEEIFISGAGKLFARSTLTKILKFKKRYPMDNLEDVSLGLLLKHLGATFIDQSFLQIENSNSVKEFNHEILNNYFYFRCKSANGVESDVEAMRVLHDKLNGMNI